MKNLPAFLVLLCLCPLPPQMLTAQDQQEKNPMPTAEQVVRQLYDLVTFEANNTPDWEKVKSLFVEEAVVILRVSRTTHKVFSRQGFVDDFQNFITRAKVDETGFVEKIISLKILKIGDMAHCWVVYEASIPGSGRPPQKGVDSFQLLTRQGQWKIISIVNEIPDPADPNLELIMKN